MNIIVNIVDLIVMGPEEITIPDVYMMEQTAITVFPEAQVVECQP